MPKGERKLKDIRKRDGRIAPFRKEKIVTAIFKAGRGTGEFGMAEARKLASRVVVVLQKKFDGHTIPEVEQIQDIVEEILIKAKRVKTAKA